MKVLTIQNCAIEGFGPYSRHLRESGVEAEVVHAYRDEPLPPLESAQAVLVHGTPVSVYAPQLPDFLRRELAWLGRALERGMPCLGICGGAQALALLLGAGVRRNPRLEIGAREVRLTAAGRADPLLRDFPGRFPVIEWHGDTFDVPTSGALLAEGDDCRNQMFRHGNVVGLQFHLEADAADVAVWSDAYAGELAEAGRTKDEVVAECRSLEAAMDPLARALMTRFLEGVASPTGGPRPQSGPPDPDPGRES